MTCPACGATYPVTIRTWTATRAGHTAVYRARLCPECRATWQTVELPAEALDRLEQERHLAGSEAVVDGFMSFLASTTAAGNGRGLRAS